MRPLFAATACAALLAACGGSTNNGTSAGVPVTAPGQSTTTGAPSNTAPSTTSTAGSRGAPPCLTADLALRYLGQEGATGHGEIGFALRNTSGHQCRTYGYPGILFLDKARKPLPTTPTHTTVDFFGNTNETELVVLPGASVSFRLGVSHGAGTARGCTTAYGLQVIAPDDTAATRTAIPHGAYECGGGATVSPLQPAETAFLH